LWLLSPAKFTERCHYFGFACAWSAVDEKPFCKGPFAGIVIDEIFYHVLNDNRLFAVKIPRKRPIIQNFNMRGS